MRIPSAARRPAKDSGIAISHLQASRPDRLSLSVYPNTRSTTVERPLQIAPFRAKQSQSPEPQNHRNLLSYNDLPQYPAPPYAKNKPNQTQSRRAGTHHERRNTKPVLPRDTQYAIRDTKYKPNSNPQLPPSRPSSLAPDRNPVLSGVEGTQYARPQSGDMPARARRDEPSCPQFRVPAYPLLHPDPAMILRAYKAPKPIPLSLLCQAVPFVDAILRLQYCSDSKEYQSSMGLQVVLALISCRCRGLLGIRAHRTDTIVIRKD